MIEVSASILSIEKEKSMKTFYNLETSKIDYFHIDVMDGKFVENNTESLMLEYAENIKQISNLPLDVHLMVSDIDKYLEQYIPLKPSFITIHFEAVKDKTELLNMINKIKINGIKCGLAVKPNTKIEEIYELLPYIHMVLVMTVEPGRGGQKLIPSTIKKVKQLKDYITKNNIDIYIQADGGINTENIEELKEAGIDIAVVGSALVKSEDYIEVVQKLKQ